MTKQSRTNASLQQRNRTNTRRLAYWTAGWLATLLVGKLGHDYLWQGNQILTLILVLLNVLAGAGLIWANKVHLQGLDELQQRLQLEAMAITLGAGLVAGVAITSLSNTGLITFNPGISHLLAVMALVYLLATVLGMRKYQ